MPDNPFLAFIFSGFVLWPIATILCMLWAWVVVFNVIVIFFVLFLVVVCVVALGFVAPYVGIGWVLRYLRRYPMEVLRVFAFGALGGALVYYVWLFDERGTSKRGWSDALG